MQDVKETKNQIGNYICKRIKENKTVTHHELQQQFRENLTEVHIVKQELLTGQIIIESPSRVNYLPGLKFNSFKTYNKFIRDVNFGIERQFRINLGLSIVILILTIIQVWHLFTTNQDTDEGNVVTAQKIGRDTTKVRPLDSIKPDSLKSDSINYNHTLK